MSLPNGAICHIEIYIKPLEISSEFYQKLFGWKITGIEQGYGFWEDRNGFSGGFTTDEAHVESPKVYFYKQVNNIKEKLTEIAVNGGAIVTEETEISGGHGSYAVFSDPAGNHIGIWVPEITEA